MIIPFQNILFLKEFFAWNGSFGLFTKIKKVPGTSFWCTFLAWFFHKNVPYLILYQWTKFQCHSFFPSQDIKQNVLLSSYLDSWWPLNFMIYLGSSSKAMVDREKKRGKWKYKNLNISNEMSFLNIFLNFGRAFISWKKNFFFKNSRQKLQHFWKIIILIFHWNDQSKVLMVPY